MPTDRIIYDVEIANPIANNWNVSKHPEIKTWAKSWEDFLGMGISCIGFYSFSSDQYCVTEDLGRFQYAIKDAEIIGFNTRSFDDRLLQAHGVDIKTHYDLLEEIRIAAGYPPQWGAEFKGCGLSYKLELMAQVNLGQTKATTGADTPIQWQKGNKAVVKAHVLQDVIITKQLYEKAELIDPNTGAWLKLKHQKDKINPL